MHYTTKKSILIIINITQVEQEKNLIEFYLKHWLYEEESYKLKLRNEYVTLKSFLVTVERNKHLTVMMN